MGILGKCRKEVENVNGVLKCRDVVNLQYMYVLKSQHEIKMDLIYIPNMHSWS